KYTRARSAVLAGADIVLEMPLPFAAGSAEYFAWAGVYIADKLGLADELMFGSESGDIDELRLIAKRQLSPEYSQRLSEIYRGGQDILQQCKGLMKSYTVKADF
ncbi:MAG: nucleotidyltransferase family protein, partial [Clostridia bacterium]|nr:nucleotidyltransferase family protein [Clostridia bacterium]